MIVVRSNSQAVVIHSKISPCSIRTQLIDRNCSSAMNVTFLCEGIKKRSYGYVLWFNNE